MAALGGSRCFSDSLQDGWQIGEYFFVAEADDPISIRSPAIDSLRVMVLSHLGFDHTHHIFETCLVGGHPDRLHSHVFVMGKVF
jgi:hypothetical protein